ncbi:glycosyltransferase family 2 protein [Neobacillus cucumis]|uniref:glycosyltransferase family A protein n=1 Tax=Neobacillus cucumis TaxID=1740721 RepID=UPI002040652F|nr:glycosyltransferase family 2 protein [Neobacillus cucumis]MCM3727693.1 glycosyltransferase family 2 protein [Neobacillus cucumis]
MNLSIIIPTLGTREKELVRLLESLKNQTYKNLQIIVVSQDNHSMVERNIEPFNDNLFIKHVKLSQKGLSKARNAAIPFITGDIVTFSDDDCWYPDNAFESVINVFQENHSKSDVICFQIFDPNLNQYYKMYSDFSNEKLNFRQIFQKSSIEIFIRLDRIKTEDLVFNEEFGLGAKYPSGEENILLSQLLRKEYTISYINQVIVYHAKPSKESRLNLKAFQSKGPLFKEIFGPYIGFLMLTALFVKKFKELDRPLNFYYSAIKEQLNYRNHS